MAKLHALSIGLRFHRPKYFENEIKPYLKPIDMYEETDTDYQLLNVSYLFILIDSMKKERIIYR